MKTPIIVIVAVLALAFGFYVWNREEEAPITTYTTPASYSTPSSGETPVSDLIHVTTPTANSTVGSPLTISGEARGYWYFEASFPVTILDASGKVLAQAPAQAQGDWMSNDFVPFSVTMSFNAATGSKGTVVLQNDNPSGLPENSREIRIPVTFGASTQTRNIKLYFYNENADKDASGNVLCSAKGLVSVNRTTPLTNTPIQDAIKELLKGPTATERAQVSGTEFPLAGVSLTSASLSGGVLTLTFTDPQNKTGGGSCRVGILKAQIEATAKQFGGVSSVRFMPSDVFQP